MIINADKIFQSARIEKIIEDFLPLNKKGTNYIASCPFHNEKTASFTVNPAKGIFKCFGCGEGGNVIKFLEKHENYSYVESLEYIAKKNKIPLEYAETTDEKKAEITKRNELQIVTNFANKFFVSNLKKNQNAIDYIIENRQFKKETVKSFGIGFCSDQWHELSEYSVKNKYNTENLKTIGVLGENKNGKLFDRLKNRIIFPYFSLTGNTIGFTARQLVDDKKQAKYINSTNSELFNKSNVLFGLFQAKKQIVKSDLAILVEGNTDVMRFHENGLKNTVGTSGTALTDMQIRLIQRFTSHVLIIFDGDTAGEKATTKSIKKFLQYGFRVDVLILPKDQDPDSFAKNLTQAEISEYIEKNKHDFFTYISKDLKKDFKNDASQQNLAIIQITEYLNCINNELERELYVKQIADIFKVSNKLIKKQLNKIEITGEDKIFALSEAKEFIKEKNELIILFNKQDVIENHLEEKENTIFIPEKLNKPEIIDLKQYSNNIILNEYPEIIEDEKENNLCITLKKFISEGFNITIITADEEYTSHIDKKEPYIDYYIKSLIWKIGVNNDLGKKIAIERSAELISFLTETERMFKIKLVKELFAKEGINYSETDYKKIVQNYLKKNKREDYSEETISNRNPHKLNETQYESLNTYGYFEKENQLFFKSNDGVSNFSNFIIEPLFHIVSINDTRKLFKIRNVKNEHTIIEVDISSMIRLEKFQEYCETKGNYVFWGSKIHFLKLKRKLYDDTKYCTQITNLGWQREGFWSWADGIIINKEFKPVDSFGIVEAKGKNYYIPANSSLYGEDKTVFKKEKMFRRKSTEITMLDFTSRFINVFGDNAKLSFCFLLTTVFSDFIFSVTGQIPLLNLFGVKGTGKTEQAITLLNFFGDKQTLLNIHKGTEYAAAVHLETFRNAIAVIDEYKNSIDIKKLEYLKSIFNRDGRLRGSIKAGVKTEEIPVNSTVILCGQEMPTLDVALFSRLVFLPHYKPEHNEAQKKAYNELKKLEKQGLTHLTEELLLFREVIESEYEDTFYDVEKELSDLLPSKIDDRLIRNYAILITTLKILQNHIKLPLNYSDVVSLSVFRIKEQFKIMDNSNELASFWQSIITLLDRGLLKEKENYIIQSVRKEKLLIEIEGQWNDKEFDFTETSNSQKELLYLRWESIYSSYAELMTKTRQEIMPQSSLEYYLRHSQSFVGKKTKKRFGEKVYTALVFDYKALGINISGFEMTSEEEQAEKIEENKDYKPDENATDPPF